MSKKSESILFHSPASISWFKTTALNSYKGTEPIFTLRSCVLGVRRASSSGQSEEHCHADRHTMQSESVSNKETKRTFAGNARYRQILLLDLKLWGCEGRVAACYYKERDYMERANTEELGNGERQADKIVGAILWAPAPNSTGTISLLTLVNPLLRYKPGVTGKFDLGVQKEAGQRLTQFCQENTLVIANTLFQLHMRRLYT